MKSSDEVQHVSKVGLPLKIWGYLLGGILLFRAILTWFIPPIADESYYLMWASHLDWSYVDHPGMIAWTTALFIPFFSNALFAARAASFVWLLGTLFWIYKTFRLTEDRHTSVKGCVFFVLIPFIFVVGMLMQVEQPLIFFVAMMLFGYAKWLKTGQKRWFFCMVTALGLGLLSKYSIIILAGALLIHLLSSSKRGLLLRPEIPLGIGLVLLISSPLWIWNAQNHWISFLFHTKRVGEAQWFVHLVEYLGDQILYLSPVLLWSVYRLRKRQATSELSSLYGSVSLLIFGFFAILSIKTKVYANWPAMGIVPLTLWIVPKASRAEHPNRLWIQMGMFTGLVCGILLLVSPGVLRLTPQVQYNHVIASELKRTSRQLQQPVYFFGDSNGTVGILSYYLDGPVYFSTLFSDASLWGVQQFLRWPHPQLKRGDTVILFAKLSPELRLKLSKYFYSVKPLPWHLTVLEGHISEKSFVVCEGFLMDR
jgi:4-amino-4-deoxy-L-arabinose transferase-like glycosyltransferase